MPVDPTRYPADWKDIATATKERAGWRCEWCPLCCTRTLNGLQWGKSGEGEQDEHYFS